MRLISSLSLALTSFVARAEAVDDVITPKARSMTMEEFRQILATDVEAEYGWTNATEAIAEQIWQDAVAYEWNKAYRAETQDPKKSTFYPYIICASHQDLSGYRRKLQILNATMSNPMNFRSVSNTKEAYCAVASLVPSKAANVEGEAFIVQPLMPSLKFVQGTVEFIQLEVENANTGNNTLYHPTLDVMLCPNAYTQDQSGEVNDWTSELTDLIMEQIFPSNISEGYYLTSESYTGSNEGTERAQFWGDLLDDYQQSDQCHDIYNERLTYHLQKSYSDTALSIIEINFNNSGVTKLDTACLLTLSLAIAILPNVCSLEMRREVKIFNTEAQWLIQSGIPGQTPFFDAGLDGSGQVVAISDTGIDEDNCYFYDAEHKASETTEIELSARKIVQYIPFANHDDYIYGHGTHVAGTVAGKRSDDGVTEVRGAADGVAPGAKIAFMDIGGMFGGLYLPNYASLLATGAPYAKIHSASWGSELNFYTVETSIFDQFTYENDDFLIVIAGGNSGDNNRMHTVGTPATGKNIVAVGAHQNAGMSAPYGNSAGAMNVAGFSSRGPTADGRMKPDVLAPGDYVLSAGARPREEGECDPLIIPEGGGASGGLLSISGTSMATPATAGTAAQIRQYFEEGYYPSGTKNEADSYKPSGALIKAILINGAQNMFGVHNTKLGITPVTPYDDTQGFGRISLKDSLFLAGKTEAQLLVYDREVVEDGASNTYTIKIDDSENCANPKLSVSLVWNEEGSRPGCRNCLLNDLDLTVTKGESIYYPNGRLVPDRKNNNERIVIDNVSAGDEFEVSVLAYNLAKTSQVYALVATGCFDGAASPPPGDDNELQTNGQGDVNIGTEVEDETPEAEDETTQAQDFVDVTARTSNATVFATFKIWGLFVGFFAFVEFY